MFFLAVCSLYILKGNVFTGHKILIINTPLTSIIVSNKNQCTLPGGVTGLYLGNRAQYGEGACWQVPVAVPSPMDTARLSLKEGHGSICQ